MAKQLDIFSGHEIGGEFRTASQELTAAEEKTLQEAFKILERTLRKRGASLNSPERVADYLKLELAREEREIFRVLFLDNQNRLIADENLFQGTIDAANVYPREIVKSALKHNAAALILAHNHPSGVAEPSAADRAITQKIQQAADLIGVRVLDHLVIGGTSHQSFATIGLMP